MTIRHRVGLGVPPILLRLALAAMFIWAGAGKFWGPMPLTPEQEATLLSIRNAAANPPPDADAPDDAPAAGEPTAANTNFVVLLVQNSQPDESAVDEPFLGEESDGATTDENTSAQSPYHGVDVLTVMIDGWATPNAEGEALLPSFMGSGKWPLWIAYAVGVVELLGGIFLLLGLVTRLWALAIAGVMIGAIWLTGIGPVVIYDEPGWPSFLPILPAFTDFMSVVWNGLLLQFMCLMTSLSLFSLGAGRFSLDRMFFGKPGAPRIEAVVEEEV